ncbi:MAG: hypothetical protein MI807_11145 [Verrucomicrobiales bacterium]|nr:hypothetical protein [Verrucomicrobiales bacterium]
MKIHKKSLARSCRKWLPVLLLMMVTTVRGDDKPIIIAHRGASKAAPENTAASIQRAVEMGAKVIEIDVRKTKDGELVLFHDKELDRLTGRKGTIEELDFESARQLDVGSWFGDSFSEEKPITLAEAIEQCRKGGAITLVEHKTGDAASYAEVIKELKAEKDVIVQSFNWTFLSGFRKRLPGIPIGALGSKKLSDHLEAITELQPEWVGWKFSDLTAENLETLHGLDFRVALWTVNDPGEAKKWIERGIDGIITDVPDVMLRLAE